MATVIDWDSVIGAATVDDGGYVGDLLQLARNHVDDAVKNNELTKEAAGEIFTAMIPAAMKEGINFAMQQALSEKKADLTATQDSEVQLNGIKDRALKDAQIAVEQDKLLSTAKARDVQEAQRRSIERQIIGYDDSKNVKAFEAQLNSWSLLNSSGMISSVEIPAVISDANLTSAYSSITQQTNNAAL